MIKIKRLSWLFILLFIGIQTARASANEASAVPLQAIDDSVLIYYRLDGSPNSTETCTTHPAITLGDFIKKTLPFEWTEGWANTPGGVESLKAGAVSIRTYALSAYHSAGVINIGGQDYRCVKAWSTRINFHSEETIADINTKYPNSVAAVNATNGVILTHPNALTLLGVNAIDPQFRAETGMWTAEGDYPWLKEVFDPISPGSPQQGMGQLGSKRWAQGFDDAGEAFPKWDYRRILAHYYSEVDFVGITPDPPNDYRLNILQVEGLPPNGGVVMCRGDKMKGLILHSQNVANTLPVDSASFPGLCSGVTNPQTLVGYHLYRTDGTQACANCVGLRSTALCHPDGAMPPGRNQISSDFEIFIPDDPALVKGNTYLLRFDLKRNGTWQGRNANFPWPPQDIPVQICDTGGGGSGKPTVTIDRPPAVVSYASLGNGPYGFSWNGRNVTRYDLQYRSKEIWSAAYPNDWVAPSNFQNMDASISQISFPLNCERDHRDWQFRLLPKNDNQSGDWVYVESRMRVWPHPWLSYWQVTGLVLDSDPGPWSRPLDLMNYGGGTFNWTAGGDQSWITPHSSGQGAGSLGVRLGKPGGIGSYGGTITVNMTNPSPNRFCNNGQSAAIPCSGDSTVITCRIPVSLSVVDHFETQYLPIIFNNNP